MDVCRWSEFILGILLCMCRWLVGGGESGEASTRVWIKFFVASSQQAQVSDSYN